MKYSKQTVKNCNDVPVRDVWEALSLPALDSKGNVNCIWHKEDTPSLRVGGAKYNCLHCFGCGKKMGVIDLVMDQKKMDFKSAVEWICGTFKIVPSNEPVALTRSKEQSKPYSIEDLIDALPIYKKKLLARIDLLQWLNDQYGLKPETIASAQLGLFKQGDAEGIVYPIPPDADPQAIKWKSIARNEKGKRATCFLAGDQHEPLCRYQENGILVWTGGEEKYFALVQEGYFAFSPLTGEQPQESWSIHARRIVEARPLEVILAADHDDSGLKSNKRMAELLIGAGFDGKIRIVEWGADTKKGYDINDALKDGKLKEYIDNAPVYGAEKKFEYQIFSGQRGALNQGAALMAFRQAHPYLFFFDNDWYEYDGKCYVEKRPNEVKCLISELLGDRVKAEYVSALYNLLEFTTYKRRECFDMGKDMIVCGNGVLDLREIDYDNPDIHLIPHSPDYYLKTNIGIDYNPNASSEWFESILETIQPNPEIRLLIQQWFGYCLVEDTSLQVCMVWLGNGQNGKGLLRHALVGLVGEQNTASLGLKNLNKEFHVERLEKKLLNFGAESDFNDMNAETLKLHVHADTPIFADVKYGRPFEFKSRARHVFLTNHDIKTADNSKGFWRSILPIRFNQQFYDPAKEKVPPGGILRDPTLYNQITKNRAAILNWSLAGLIDLRRRGIQGFAIPDTCIKDLEQMRLANDSIAAFCAERCTIEKDPAKVKEGKIWTRTKKLYDAYREFCNETNSGVKKKSNFSGDLRMLFPFIHKQFDGDGNEIYVCVKFNDDDDNEVKPQKTNYQDTDTLF